MLTKMGTDLDWKDKVVLFYAKSAGPELGTGIVIESPIVKELFGKPYFVGRSPKYDEWTAGLSTAILVEEVFHFVIFDSLEDFQRRIKTTRFAAPVNIGPVGGTKTRARARARVRSGHARTRCKRPRRSKRR